MLRALARGDAQAGDDLSSAPGATRTQPGPPEQLHARLKEAAARGPLAPTTVYNGASTGGPGCRAARCGRRGRATAAFHFEPREIEAGTASRGASSAAHRTDARWEPGLGADARGGPGLIRIPAGTRACCTGPLPFLPGDPGLTGKGGGGPKRERGGGPPFQNPPLSGTFWGGHSGRIASRLGGGGGFASVIWGFGRGIHTTSGGRPFAWPPEGAALTG